MELRMSNPDDEQEIAYARMLAARLERLSVDSYWAHRSSGLRGSLLRALERVDGGGEDAEELHRLRVLIQQGSALLARAARELRGDEERR
jgi:hypothetical protein